VTGNGTAAGLIAYGHFNNNQITLNLLSNLQATPGPSLSAGTYSVWMQEIGSGDAPLPLRAYGVLAVLLLAALKNANPRRA
jgi:hypothetical protein